MDKKELAKKIKETEEQLASLRAELEKPEYPTLQSSKAGDKLENGCIVVHKFEDVRMALISAPDTTEDYFTWNKRFPDVFEALERKGFNPSQWFIPNVEQLKLAYNNCKQHFPASFYWSSTEASSSSTNACGVGFLTGSQHTCCKPSMYCVRAFSLVSY
jgi:hypothetical protein